MFISYRKKKTAKLLAEWNFFASYYSDFKRNVLNYFSLKSSSHPHG